ncbi:hypothetical protein [Paraburkholderia bannensis]|uniref:hypothetical protein n=1 Tax=Paraburkholderia bannensis TaxID=765414 RepID=UPI000483BF1C|nr:hypothetical protein [Paraburkholderia bannensis]
MQQQLAEVAIALGGAMLFGGFVCAFAQFAALAPGWARRAPVHRKPGCKRNIVPQRHLLFAISFALLSTVAPGVIAALFVPRALPVAAAEAGALVGLWLTARANPVRHASVTSAVGAALGVAATGAGVIGILSASLHSIETRLAFYLIATLGALAFGAFATACRLAREQGFIGRKRTALSRGEHVLHLAALALIVALGVGMAVSPGSMEFAVSALGAACVLAVALGVRAMGGARHMRESRIARIAHDVSKRSAPAPLAAVPDAWLVAACGPAAYEPANFDTWISVYEAPVQAPHKTYRASRDSRRRRRRSR